MKAIISVIVLLVFVAIYSVSYIINNKIEKPKNCKELECEICSLDCYKKNKDRSE